MDLIICEGCKPWKCFAWHIACRVLRLWGGSMADGLICSPAAGEICCLLPLWLRFNFLTA